MTKPYRPTIFECEIFVRKFCDDCKNNKELGCKILGRTFGGPQIEFQREWIEDETGPHCTAFMPDADLELEAARKDPRQAALPL